jgi:hypothetical protein
MKEELKIYLYRLGPFLVFLVGLPLLSYVIWLLIPSKQLEVLIIDKTVRDKTYREHAGLFWTLEHQKYKKSSGDFYSEEWDYLGFFPNGKADLGEVKDLEGRSEEEIKKLASDTDLIYLADTYGVYEDDFDENPSNERSKKIYGGLNEADLQLIKAAGQEGKVVVAEFNSIASPTPASIRNEFENLMGLKWTGWIGRYFDELDTVINSDIPTWMVRQYQRQHERWDLSGPGLVFIKETGEIEAFIFGTDYSNKVPLIRTQKINKHGFKLPEVVPYPDWFDVVMIERDYEVISYYDINPSNEGLQRLRRMGLPRFFPAAVVRKLDKGSQYYFSGDFSDIGEPFGATHFFGLPILWRGFYVASDYTDRQSFYWNYYYPLVNQVLGKTKKEASR